MEYHYTWNVDTGTFSTFVGLNVGDIVTVYANVPDTTPDANPISWGLGQSPANGQGHKSIEMVDWNYMIGTMTFKVLEPGVGHVYYTVTSGALEGQANDIQLKVYGAGSVLT